MSFIIVVFDIGKNRTHIVILGNHVTMFRVTAHYANLLKFIYCFEVYVIVDIL